MFEKAIIYWLSYYQELSMKAGMPHCDCKGPWWDHTLSVVYNLCLLFCGRIFFAMKAVQHGIIWLVKSLCCAYVTIKDHWAIEPLTDSWDMVEKFRTGIIAKTYGISIQYEYEKPFLHTKSGELVESSTTNASIGQITTFIQEGVRYGINGWRV